MIAVREPVAPPHPWMPTVWAHDAQGLPVRHRPGRPYGDLWVAMCGEVFLFDFEALRAVMELTPCLECLDLGEPPEYRKPS